jgi:hypothetical protein
MHILRRPKRGDAGELVPHEAEQQAIREIVALRAKGTPLRAIADAVRAQGRQDQPRGRGGRPASARAITSASPGLSRP